MFCGGAEHRELKFSQLTRDFTSDGLIRFTYTENHSNNRCGGFNKLDIENKVVEQFQDLHAGDRCHTFCICIFPRFQTKLLNKTSFMYVLFLRSLLVHLHYGSPLFQ